VGLAVIGALALACFVKVAGVLYLGAPRTPDAGAAQETGWGMTGPMVGLALACGAIGLLPIAVVPLGLRVGALIAGGAAGTAATTGTGSPAAGPATGFILGLTGLIAVIALLCAALRRRQAYASAATWGCGYALPTPRMAYTSSSFAAPLVGAFRLVAGIQVNRSAESLVTHPFDPILDRVILPVWRGLRGTGEYLRSRQRGPLPLYLLYVVAAVLSVLLYLFVTGSGR
jgi:hypothetical protein